MPRYFFTTALRRLKKHPGFSLINVAGLAVGISCFIAIMLFVQDELAFDRFHRNVEHLYRLNKVVTPEEGGDERHAITSGRMGPTLVLDYPEVRQSVRFLPWFDPVLVQRQEQTTMLAGVAFADANFFEVFDFELVRGDPGAVLTAPFSVVLTVSSARRIFGDEDPVGRTVEGLGDREYTVTGVAEDPPAHSHLDFHALLSWSTTEPGKGGLEYAWMNNWLTQVHFTYLLLEEGADPGALEAKLPSFMDRHFPERSAQYQLYLQPFSDVYLGSADLLHTRGLRTGNRTYVYVFSIVGVLMLLIAGINFVNLATARASEREREVGVRKALGAGPKQLTLEHLGESFHVVMLATIAAVLLVYSALPELNAFTGKHLELDLLERPSTALWLALLVGAITLISGLYPAAVLSRVSAAHALRPAAGPIIGGVRVRQMLVAAQFAITIALFVATAVVYQQVRFTQTKELGFNEEQLLMLPIGDTQIGRSYEAFRQELLQHPDIVNAAGASHVPGTGTLSFSLRPEGKPATESWTSNVMRLDDDDLVDTYGMRMAAGRFFDQDRPTDIQSGVVINESLAQTLGWDDPIGKRLDIEGELANGRIIGVVEDFHYQSLHQAIAPLVMYVAPRHRVLTVRFSTNDLPALLGFLKERWAAHEQARPFEYAFVDGALAEFYETDMRLMRTLTLFSVLTIFVACLGLFGLALHAAQRRTKEIGIRKVLGASTVGIVGLLTGSFARLVLIGAAFATPVAYLLAESWLARFAYRIELGPGVFLFAIGFSLLIAVVTVSYQALRVALADPVKSLHYE